MAAPAAHVVLAEKIRRKYFSGNDELDFYVGTLFSDIRYLGGIRRDQTHFADVNLSSLADVDAFTAGLMVHSYVDVNREKFVAENDFYALCPKSRFITQSVKIYEDMLFYDLIGDWNHYLRFLDKVIEPERRFGLADDILEKWHDILRDYLSAKPDPGSIRRFVMAAGYSSDNADEVISNISAISGDPRINDVLLSLPRYFDELSLR